LRPPTRALRARWLAALFLIAVSAPFFLRLDDNAFHGDETG